MKCFFDCEFTGLHKDTTLISLGIVSDNDKQIYCEFTDYDDNQVDDWLREHVFPYMMMQDEFMCRTIGNLTLARGPKDFIEPLLTKWLKQFDTVELWSDVQHYDVVCLFDIWGHAFTIPKHIYYIPFDISAYFKFLGLDPDTDREAFIDKPISGDKHNALYDALVIRACYDKLQRNKEEYLKKLV